MKTTDELKKERVRLADLKKIPNLLSSFRLISSFVILGSGILLIDELWVGILYLAAIISDKLDGIIARSTQTQTKLGLVLETVADSVLTLAVVIFIARTRDLPHTIFVIVLGFFIIQVIILGILFLRRRYFFITSLNSSRVAVFFLHITGIMYFFWLPYREVSLIAVMAVGLFAYIDNLFKTIRAKKPID